MVKGVLLSLLFLATSHAQVGTLAFIQKEVEVISALKQKEKLSEVPRKMVVITREEINRWGAKNLFELLKYIPGFYVNVNHFGLLGVGVFGIRQSYLSEKVQVLIDGQPLTDPVTGSSFSSDNNITLDNVKRVEIIYGPMTSLYGANACLAVVNLVTYDADDFNRGKAEVSYGNWKSNDSYLILGRRFKGWSALLFSSYREDIVWGRSYTDHYGSRGELETYRKHANFHFKLNSDSGFYSSVYYVDRDNSFPLSVFGRISNRDFADRKALLSKFGYRFRLSGFDVDAQSHLDWFYLKRGGSYLLPGQKIIYYNKDWKGGFTIDLRRNLSSFGSLLVGFDTEHVSFYNADTYTNFDLLNPLSPSLLPSLKKQESLYGSHIRNLFSIYAQHFIKKGRWYLLSNFNVEHFSDVGSAFAFNFSGMYSLSEGISIKLNGGRAVRVPSLEELYLKNNLFVLGNKDLDFEKVDSLMLSFEVNNRRFSIEPTIYLSRIKDFIVQDYNKKGILQWANADEDVKTFGALISGKALLSENVQVYGSLTYSRVLKGGLETYSLKMPEWKGISGVTFSYERLLFDVNALALSRVSGKEVKSVPGFYVVNANLRFRLSGSSYLSFRVDNVFDRDVYYPVSVQLAPIEPSGMIDYGRRVFISYEIAF